MGNANENVRENTGLSRFDQKLFGLLDQIEYRRIQSMEDMEEVGRLRAKAYEAANLIPATGKILIDDVDFDPNTYVFGIYHRERLISTVRIHHVSPEHPVSSAGTIFPNAINSFLDAGLTMIDPVKLAADPDVVRELPAIPYLTLRIATMASDYFSADRCLAIVRPDHASFYKRVFEAKLVSEPMSDNPYGFDLMLLATDVNTVLSSLYRRYPFFRSHLYEQRMMFGNDHENEFDPLTIRPTARYAVENKLAFAA